MLHTGGGRARVIKLSPGFHDHTPDATTSISLLLCLRVPMPVEFVSFAQGHPPGVHGAVLGWKFVAERFEKPRAVFSTPACRVEVPRRHARGTSVAARSVGSGRNRQHNRIRADPQTCARSCSARTLPRRPVRSPPFPPLPPIHLTPPTRPRLDLAFEDGIPRYGGGCNCPA